jgi:hypothetical protein
MAFISRPVEELEKSLRDYASPWCEDIKLQESDSKLEVTKYEIKVRIIKMAAATPFEGMDTENPYHNAMQRGTCWGSLPSTVNLYRSCVGLGWLAQETTGFRLVWAQRSNTLCPMSSCRVPELGVLVVGVTSWSGEGVEPKSLGVAIEPSKV